MKSVSDASSIAFVGSQVANDSELAPHMGAYNLAETSA